MFAYILLGLSFLAIVVSGAISFIDSDKALKSQLILGLLVVGALVTLIQGVYSQISAREIERVNNKLIGYASGGEDNKPVMSFDFQKQDDGSYISSFRILNRGDYPLNNVYYEISDSYTVQANALDELGFASLSGLSEEQIMQLNKYSQGHQRETIVQGSIPNIPKNVGAPIPYQGRVVKEMPALMYLVKFAWNNQNYSAVFEFEKDPSTDLFKPLSINITDGEGNQVTDLEKFFPQVPAEYWQGFPTTLDPSSKVRQFEASVL